MLWLDAMTDSLDFYKVLQVDPSAEPEVIQAAYRRLAQKYHPDAHGPAASEARMKSINLAYEVLGDLQKRAVYDRQQAQSKEQKAKNDSAPSADPFEEQIIRLIRQQSVATAQRSIPRQVNTIADLDGYGTLQASDGTYLGLISSQAHQKDSIMNPYGNYGSAYSNTSIWNPYGTYGSQYGPKSPNNPYCSSPPVIVVNNSRLFYLTVNPYLRPAITPRALVNQLRH